MLTPLTSHQNPDMMPDLPKIDAPVLSDVIFPSSSSSSSSSSGPSITGSAGDLVEKDQYGYSQPFAATKKYLERHGGVVPDGGIAPSNRGEFSSGLLSDIAPSSKAPSKAPSSKAPSSKAPSQVPSKAPSSKAVSTKSQPTKPFSARSDTRGPAGGVKVLPSGPVPPLSPVKTPHSVASKKTTTPHSIAPRSKVPTPAPSIKPHSHSPVLTKGSRTGNAPKSKSPHQTAPSPALECHISVDDRPDIPLKAKMPKNIEGTKWLNHRPVENFDEGNVEISYFPDPIALQKFGMSQSHFT